MKINTALLPGEHKIYMRDLCSQGTALQVLKINMKEKNSAYSKPGLKISIKC